MDVLILSPPACTPAEPPAGAFVLAAALAGHGVDAGLLDLSLELYHRVLDSALRERAPGSAPAPGVRALRGAMGRLLGNRDGYLPEVHRSDLGHLHRALGRFAEAHPGWRLSLMDLTPEVGVTAPARLASWIQERGSPLAALWEEVLDPVLDAERPRRVLVSLAYLSQLAGTIDLVAHLRRRGVRPVVGGSLVRSLALTGSGLGALAAVLGGPEALDPGDGSALLAGAHPDAGDSNPVPASAPGAAAFPGDGRVLQRLAWPHLLSARPYLTSRPIVPVPLSVGCYWRRCLFCPDRGLPFRQVPLAALQGLLETVPEEVRAAGPVLHLLDSAIPPAALHRALPLFREHGVGFYGFARPTREWLTQDRLGAAAEAGGRMLQLGVEGGSGPLLERFHKGLDPAEAAQVVTAAAEAGLRTYLYLLFGLPGEQEAHREQTLAMVGRLGEAGAVDFLNLSLFNLPRESELTHRAAEFGIAPLMPPPGAAGEPGGDGDDEDALRLYWAFRHEGRDVRADARRFLKARLGAHPALRAAERRTPRWLRAAHLALMRLPGRRDP